MLSPTARTRLKRVLVFALLICGLLPVILFGLLRQHALELASKNPWSKQQVMTTFSFEEVAVTDTCALSQTTLSYTVRERTATEVRVAIERGDGPSVEVVYPLAVPETRFDESAPIESVTTPYGTFQARRVETLSEGAHDVYWIAPELPLFVKHTRTTRDGVTTTTLTSVTGW